MKALRLLPLAAFFSIESAEATTAPASAPAPTTSIVSTTSTGPAALAEVLKRRKRKKSRPAYRRLGSLQIEATPVATA